MRKAIYFLTAIFFVTAAHYGHSADKVVVIPLNSGAPNVPDSSKTVSVSSIGANLGNQDNTYSSTVCGSIGKYYSGPSANKFFNIPVHLPDGATITSFTGIFCDNSDAVPGYMWLRRSDDINLTLVRTSRDGHTTTPVKRTSTTINEPVIDNSQYAYYIKMTAGNTTYTGPDFYPISAHITLE